MANKITTILEVITGGAQRDLGKLRSEVQNTDGAFNKLKVGAKGAGDFIKANIAEGAIAAGAALAAFGAQSLKTFQDTALEAKNLASLTGDNVEQSSRLNAIWKQSGADAKDLQDVLLQMNGVLSTNKTLVKELGINLEDGATVGQRFEQVADALDQIPDAAKRSQMASQVFGEEGVRQYNALRNAVGDVGEAMANVSDAQVIDEDEVRKAERLREAMKKLNTAIADIQLVAAETAISVGDFIKDTSTLLGNVLSPWNRDAREANKEITEAWDKSSEAAANFDRELLKNAKSSSDVWNIVNGLTGDVTAANIVTVEWTNTQKRLNEELRNTIEAANGTTDAATIIQREIDAAAERYRRFGADGVENMGAVEEASVSTADAAGQLADAINEQRDAAREAAEAMRDQADGVYDLYGAEASLEDAVAKANEVMEQIANGEFEGSQRDAREAVIDVARAADEQANALLATKGLTMDSVTGQREWVDSMLDSARTLSGPLRQEVLNHISRVTGIPTEILTKFGVEMDSAALAKIQADLDAAARTRFVRFAPTGTAGGAIIDGGDTGPRTRTGVGATGGIVTQATRAIIGENGPEAVIPLNQMPGASALPGGMGGGVTVVVQGHIYGDSHLRQVIADEIRPAIAKSTRINGPGF